MQTDGAQRSRGASVLRVASRLPSARGASWHFRERTIEMVWMSGLASLIERARSRARRAEDQRASEQMQSCSKENLVLGRSAALEAGPRGEQGGR